MAIGDTLQPYIQPEQKEKLDLSFLVADDEPIIRESLERLIGFNYPIITVANGQKLIDAPISNPGRFNIILTDNDMLQDDEGIEAIRKIRAMEQFKNLPIVIMTGRPKNEDFYEELQKLKVVLIEKPFRYNDLLEKIKEARSKVKSP